MLFSASALTEYTQRVFLLYFKLYKNVGSKKGPKDACAHIHCDDFETVVHI